MPEPNGANKTEDGPLDWESSIAPENFSVLLLTWNIHRSRLIE